MPIVYNVDGVLQQAESQAVIQSLPKFCNFTFDNGEGDVFAIVHSLARWFAGAHNNF